MQITIYGICFLMKQSDKSVVMCPNRCNALIKAR